MGDRNLEKQGLTPASTEHEDAFDYVEMVGRRRSSPSSWECSRFSRAWFGERLAILPLHDPCFIPRMRRLVYCRSEGLEARCTQAFWVSAFQTFIAYWFLHKSFFVCFLILLVGIPGAVLGIVATPLVVKIWKQKGAFFKRAQATVDKVSDTAEKVRSGEISLKPDFEAAGDVVRVAVAVAAATVADAAISAKDSVMEHLPEFGKADEVVEHTEDKPACPDQSVGEVSAEEQQRLDLEAAQAAIDNFTGKRKESR